MEENNGTKPKGRAFGYLRVSRLDLQRGMTESESINSQRMDIILYCAKNGYEYIGEFVDDGKSGETFDRKGFQQLLAAVRNGDADTVITTYLARLGRPLDWDDILFEEFPKYGIRYLALHDKIDSDHYDEHVIETTYHNSRTLIDTSKRVRSALRARREFGIYCAAPPYGYMRNPEDIYHLVPDKEAAPIVKRIFERAAAGDSSHKIAADLTKDAVPTPSMHNALNGKLDTPSNRRIGTHWSPKTIQRILENRVYLGHTALGRTRSSMPFIRKKKKTPLPPEEWSVTEDTHPAIVGEELYAEANKNMSHTSYVRKSDGDSDSYHSIFNGITYCGLCGSAMSLKRPSTDSPVEQWQLDCNRHRNDIDNPCCGAPIYYESLKAAVLAYLADTTALTDEDLNSIATTALSNEETCNAILSDIKLLETAIVFNERKINKLYDDNLNGLLSDDQHERAVRGCQSAISDAQTRIDALQQELATLNNSDNAEERERLITLAKQLSRIETLDRETLQQYVDRIEVFPRELPPGLQKLTHPDKHDFSQQIEIYLKFAAEMQ